MQGDRNCLALFSSLVSFRHEIININLKNKPEWFFKKNPFGLVPVLENSQGHLITESVITCEYLDEAYPEKKLFPNDPYEKACQKMTFELFSKVSVRSSSSCLENKYPKPSFCFRLNQLCLCGGPVTPDLNRGSTALTMPCHTLLPAFLSVSPIGFLLTHPR